MKNKVQSQQISLPMTLPAADWTTTQLARPGAKVRIGTLFSGIGAAEHALTRMGIRHEIAFAGDIDPHVRKTYLANHTLEPSNWHNRPLNNAPAALPDSAGRHLTPV